MPEAATEGGDDLGERAAVGLGSNRGDRIANLAGAVARLGDVLRDMECSRVYETEPVGSGYRGQRSFLNMCCVGRYGGGARSLLRELQRVEADLGRRRRAGEALPRRLDLDLLLYGDSVVSEPELEVPHPALEERAFVLVPLAELAPGWEHPVSGVSVGELAGRVSTGGVRPYGGDLPEPIRRRTGGGP